MSSVITFRPTADDFRIISEAQSQQETVSDVIRRALRYLDQEAWLERFRAEAAMVVGEDLNQEPEAW
jgi:hypothetical protein